MIDASQRIVEYAAGRGVEIVYSFPDSFRHRLDSITALSKAGVDAGADGVYIYDSRGQSTPRSSFVICREIKKAIGDKLLYVQHHNDLGMATACSLAAAEAGRRRARRVDLRRRRPVGDGCARGGRGRAVRLRVRDGDQARSARAARPLRGVGVRIRVSGDEADRRLAGELEEGWGHRDPDDPVESPMAIAGEVLGTPFESVIGPNVFGKIKITQAPGVHKHRISSPTSWTSSGSSTATTIWPRSSDVRSTPWSRAARDTSGSTSSSRSSGGS